MPEPFLLAAVEASTVTTGRLAGTLGALVALAGAVIGGLALARPAGGARMLAMVGLGAGLVGMAVGGLVVAAAEGGPGTGFGIVGGVAALGIGFIAAVLAGLALRRARRAV